MKTAEEIAQQFLARIAQLYGEPERCVRDFHALDAVLFEVHWQYANAMNQMDRFVAVRFNYFKESVSQFLKLQGLIEKHQPIDSAGDAKELIEYWSRLDNLLGWKIDPDESPNG